MNYFYLLAIAVLWIFFTTLDVGSILVPVSICSVLLLIMIGIMLKESGDR